MIKTIWRRFLAERLARSLEARTSASIDAKLAALENQMRALVAQREAADRVATQAADAELSRTVEQLREEFRTLGRHSSLEAGNIVDLALARIQEARPWAGSLFLPRIGLSPYTDVPYMAWSTCSAADMQTGAFADACAELGRAPSFHRKLWEWAFIVHHLRRLDLTGEGRSGLVFGVGTEPLPSLFAKDGAKIVATDAPEEISLAAGWEKTNEFASKIEDIRVPGIIDRDLFGRKVSYATCDMNNIDEQFRDFDFCWSSCSLEHLGSLEAGMEFVVNSVEQTLRIGGVACHTTEFNLSSNTETIETGGIVLYRKRDIEALVERLRDRGHHVDDFRIAPDHHPLDFHVDVPPYTQNPHLRLSLLGYTSTSVGLVIRRGR